MQVSTEFSKYASHYGQYNVIQNKVVKHLLSFVQEKPAYILDLGCGRGAVVENIDWEYKHFVGVDFAKGMLDLHPKGQKIELIESDFNNAELFKELQKHPFDRVISASALQWAKDLEKTFCSIASLNAPVALAIFSANTFKTLNDTANLPPLLRSRETLEALQKRYFPDALFEVMEYKLEFENVRDIFRYIKRSGVSGSRKVLSYKETKELMQRYPNNILEFEVVFIAHVR
jgi:malonyl-CoA O-methyltransferase